jgi:class 3 adenylate cyclase
MTLEAILKDQVATIFRSAWTTRKGQTVPEPEALGLGNDAVEFDRATVLYADLSGSTALVNSVGWDFAAEIYKSYLYCAAKIVRAENGAITSYDGDRIMGIFIGASQCDQAIRCALKINHAARNIINPALHAQYPSSGYSVTQVVGVDISSIRAARTGIRNGNDIVWVGRAANYAAKLTELKSDERSWITKDVYDGASSATRYKTGTNTSMWKSYKWTQNADYPVYGSGWWWPF